MPNEHIAAVDKIVVTDPNIMFGLVSLRDYVDSRLVGLDHVSRDRHELMVNEIKRLDELSLTRMTALEKAGVLFSQKIEAQFMAVNTAQALAASSLQLQFGFISRSTDTATQSLDKRLEGMNEFREQMNDMASKFITRADVESTEKYMSERTSSVESNIANCISRQEMQANQTAINERVSTLEKFSANTQGRMWVIAAVVVIMEIALRFLSH